MGKGTIISGGIGGEYSVQIEHLTTELNANIAKNTASLATVNAQIAIETDADKLTTLKLKKASLLADQKYLQGLAAKINTTGWCVDVTENMTGTVGTIEVPGERRTFVNLQNDNTHTPARDGQLEKAGAGKMAAVIWNLAMLPGWQKWKPTYRYATITSLNISSSDYGNDYCDVTLESAISTQQSLDVNQTTTLSNVPIKYMDCNGAGFNVGDVVIVRFKGQDWNDPEVIGYKDHPRYCHERIVITVGLLPARVVETQEYEVLPGKKAAMVWDPKLDSLHTAPVDSADVSFKTWFDGREQIEKYSNLDYQGECGTESHIGGIEPENRVNFDPYYGHFDLSTQASGCPDLAGGMTDEFVAHTANPEYPWVMDEYGYNIKAATFDPVYTQHPVNADRCFPRSGTYEVLFPASSPVQKIGFRTHTINWRTWGPPDYNMGPELTTQWEAHFYTPFGQESFIGDATYGIRTMSAFDYGLVGYHSAKVIFNLCYIQHNKNAHSGDPVGIAKYSYVHAQAIYDRNGVDEIDWLSEARNTALETQIKNTIELAYTLNEVDPTIEIRYADITISIVR